jgi:hypothetical protein
MPALHSTNHLAEIHKRQRDFDDDDEFSATRIVGIILVAAVFLAVLFFAFRITHRRRQRMEAARQAARRPVRPRSSSGPVPQNSSRPTLGLRPRTGDLENGVTAPPPVYVKDQEGSTVLRDPPPPYVEGRQGPS